MATIIDGKAISQQIKEEVKASIEALAREGITVTLAVIQVGADHASSVYVRNKKKACEATGIRSLSYELPEETTEAELLDLIRELNDRKDVNGILVQLPLPKGIDEEKVLDSISPLKDVDGFHPQNVGCLSVGKPGFVSCTPAGVIQLLKRSGVEIAGKNADAQNPAVRDRAVAARVADEGAGVGAGAVEGARRVAAREGQAA